MSQSHATRLLDVGPYTDLKIENISYDSKVLLGKEYTVSVQIDPAITNAAIYMEVTDECKPNLHFKCAKVNPSNPCLEKEVAVQLRHTANGVYQGKYTVTNSKAGHVTLSFYAISNGLHMVCFANEKFTEPPVEQRTDKVIKFEWEGEEILCAGRYDFVSMRWTGKLLITEEKEYYFQLLYDDNGKLFIDGIRLIGDFSSPGKDKVTKANKLLEVGEHELRLDLGEDKGGAEIKFNWLDPLGSGNYVSVPNENLACVVAIVASPLVEITCDKGFFISPDTKICEECGKGTYSDAEGVTACTKCGEGHYNDEEGSASPQKCRKCLEGTHGASVGAEKCEECPVGTYADERGLRECKPCPVGKYGNVTKLSQCVDCHEGTYNDMEGATQCKLCARGTFSATPGSVQCELCPKGTYNNKLGQESNSSCLNCPPMMYGDVPGLSQCKDCPIRSYVDDVKAQTCYPCNPLCNECYGDSNTECISCVEGTGALYIAPDTCECPNNFYYDEEDGRCRACHLFCLKCTGPSSDDCINCNTSVSLAVEGKPGTCVLDCDSGYYRDSSLCKGKLYKINS